MFVDLLLNKLQTQLSLILSDVYTTYNTRFSVCVQVNRLNPYLTSTARPVVTNPTVMCEASTEVKEITEEEVIVSPGYQKEENYGDDLDCFLRRTTNKTDHLKIEFLYMELENDYDKLKVIMLADA